MAQALPYIAVTIHEVGEFRIGEERVKSLGFGQGTPGYVLVIVELEPCEDEDATCPTVRRFMVPPTGLTFECGEPTDIPEENIEGATKPKPTLFVPDHIAEQRIKRQQ